MGQIALPLSPGTSVHDGHAIVTDCNRDILAQLDNADNWPFRTALLVGPAFSGKSVIGDIFAAQHGGVFIDDAEMCDDDALFHLWNKAQQAARPLLLAAHVLPVQWGMKLPDLKSRIGASQILELGPPDDPMRAGLLHKLLALRGLAISDSLVDFALVRLERSYAAIQGLAREIDRLSLERKSPIGQRLVAEATEVASAQMDLPI